MKAFIPGLFVLACVACDTDELLSPIPDEVPSPGAVTVPEGRSRDGPGQELFVPDEPTTIPVEDGFDSPCEDDEFYADGTCYTADEIPQPCEHNDLILHSGADPRIAADEDGPMVVLNAADGSHLYGYRWDGTPRFDGRHISDGPAVDIQRTEDGRFTVPSTSAGGDDLLFIDGAGELTAYSLPPNLFGRVQATDGVHLLTQRVRANAYGQDDVEVLGDLPMNYLPSENRFATVQVLSVQGDVWVYDDWSVARLGSEQSMLYDLTIWVNDPNVQGLTGISVYAEILPSEAYRWARAKAIVAQEGRFAVAWQRGSDGSGRESFMSFIHYDGALSGMTIPALAIEDMVASENGELLAVIVNDSSKPKQVHLMRIDGLGTTLVGDVVASIDDAYSLRLTRAAGRTALTWSTAPTEDPTNGLVHLLILCPE